MRRLIITTTAIAAVLSLAACRNNDQHDNTLNIDENLTAENIVSNDVTAIDAVTADAANMAADVNYANTEDNSVAVDAGPEAANDSAPKPHAQKSRTPARPPEPAANSSSNSAE
jgi:hypothetical protein